MAHGAKQHELVGERAGPVALLERPRPRGSLFRLRDQGGDQELMQLEAALRIQRHPDQSRCRQSRFHTLHLLVPRVLRPQPELPGFGVFGKEARCPIEVREGDIRASRLERALGGLEGFVMKLPQPLLLIAIYQFHDTRSLG
jgi:hypothetical protein